MSVVANALAISHCVFDFTAHTPFIAAASALVLWVSLRLTRTTARRLPFCINPPHSLHIESMSSPERNMAGRRLSGCAGDNIMDVLDTTFFTPHVISIRILALWELVSFDFG